MRIVWSEAEVHWTAALAMGVQVKHDPAEVNEYVPAAQGVHVVAPALVPVFVMEPAPQLWQEASPEFPKYPASQVVIFSFEPVVHWTVAALAMVAQV